jgi:hypothetical protein
VSLNVEVSREDIWAFNKSKWLYHLFLSHFLKQSWGLRENRACDRLWFGGRRRCKGKKGQATAVCTDLYSSAPADVKCDGSRSCKQPSDWSTTQSAIHETRLLRLFLSICSETDSHHFFLLNIMLSSTHDFHLQSIELFRNRKLFRNNSVISKWLSYFEIVVDIEITDSYRNYWLISKFRLISK